MQRGGHKGRPYRQPATIEQSGDGNFASGTKLAIGIGLQNVPEGLAVPLALLSIRYNRVQAFVASALTGLVEPVIGLAGAYAAGAVNDL